MTLAEGDAAPDFSLPATNGQTVSLSQMTGKPFILYFYPKADTPGCTREACAFQEAKPELDQVGLPVVGVSTDKLGAIEKFAAKYNLSFLLASDMDHLVADSYGAWVEKSMYGRRYLGMDRSTFLIDAAGRIAKIWRKVSVTGHVQDVMKSARTLPSG